jgi:hypothetical protein
MCTTQYLGFICVIVSPYLFLNKNLQMGSNDAPLNCLKNMENKLSIVLNNNNT